MILRAPTGSIKEVMVWLQGLQGVGAVTAADPAAQEEGDAGLGRPEGGGALIDPRRVNVFLGEVQVDGECEASAPEAGEEGLAL